MPDMWREGEVEMSIGTRKSLSIWCIASVILLILRNVERS
jgi:hypothetical protein